jgi:hypothetical protein
VALTYHRLTLTVSYLASSDSLTRKQDTVKCLLKRRPARQCAALSRKGLFLFCPLRRHRQVSAARAPFLLDDLFFLTTRRDHSRLCGVDSGPKCPSGCQRGTVDLEKREVRGRLSDTASVTSSSSRRSTTSFILTFCAVSRALLRDG